MPIITLTISIDVPEGVDVAISTATKKAVDTIVPRLRDAVEQVAADLTGREATRWSRSEEMLAEDLSLTDAEVSERIGRSAAAVHAFRLSRGIIQPSKPRVIAEAERAMRKWTVAEVEFLEEYAGSETTTAQEVADALGRTREAVRSKAVRAGFIPSEGVWK